MATLEQIEEGIRRADKAGDIEGLKALAAERQRLLAAPPASPAASGDARAELSRITQDPASGVREQQREQKVEQFRQASPLAKGITTAYDAASLAAGAPLLGFGEKMVAGIRAPFTDKTYAQELAAQREQTELSRERLNAQDPDALIAPATALEVGSQVAMLPSLVARQGAGLITRAAAPVLEGLGYGGAMAVGQDADIGTGLGLGAGGGVAGGLLGKLVTAGGARLGQAFQTYAREPSEKARQRLFVLARNVGITPDTLTEAIRQYGPEGMAIDVLGKAARAPAAPLPMCRRRLARRSRPRWLVARPDRMSGWPATFSGPPA